MSKVITPLVFKKMSQEDQELLKMKIIAMYVLQIAHGHPVKIAEQITMRELNIGRSLLLLFAPQVGAARKQSNTRQAWLGR